MLRRVLLLFAIVLGMAAIAGSLASSPERADDPRKRTPEAVGPTSTSGVGAIGPSARPLASTTVGGPRTIELRSGSVRRSRALATGEPATLLVAVDAPGQVGIPGLGLVQPAEPLTPARFEVMANRPGRYRVILRPAADDSAPSILGILDVRRRGGGPAS